MESQLIKKIEFEGEILLLSGLHIGASNSGMQIGGLDKVVIRNPINKQPYIPGSSLKGKMRALFEMSTGNIGDNCMSAATGLSAELFGNATGKANQRASRIIVRDCNLANPEEILGRTEMPYTEGKTEVSLNRITAIANPRHIERVPAGAKFTLRLVLNIWKGEDENQLLNSLIKSLELLQDDYLGGNGSRGYGMIQIKITRISSKSTSNYYGKVDVEPIEVISDQEFQRRIQKLK
mgnify:CR=1 FL=1